MASTQDLLPPGPHSRVLTTLRYATDYVGAMQRWHAEYGPTFTLRDLVNVTVVTSDPELIQRVFSEPRAESLAAAAPPSFDVLVGKGSLLLLPGAAHHQRRKVLSPAFCREGLPSWTRAMVEATRTSFAPLEPGQRFIARERLQEATLRVIQEVLFGAAGAVGDQLRDAMITMLARVNPRFLVTRLMQHELAGYSAFGRYMQVSREFDRRLLEHVAERRRAPGESMLDRMLDSRDVHGELLEDAAIVDELRTLLLGGHETTSTTLAWALDYVHRDPALLERLRAEVDTLDEPSMLARSPLLGAVIDETMRIRPVAGQVFRRLAEPMSLGRWRLTAGVTVSPAPCLVHLRPDLWPDPERFDPDRFLAGPPSPGSFIPYGGGSHRCLGAIFARFEAAVILGSMLRELELELVDARAPAWVRDGLPLGPSGGVPMRLIGWRRRA